MSSQPRVRVPDEDSRAFTDWVAPLRFHPEHEVNFSLRPAYTLGRAALESAAQAVWMLDTDSPVECIRRHICLMRWDLQEHRKSKSDQADKDAVKAREADLVHGVSEAFTEERIVAPSTFLTVIRAAASASDLRLEPETAEYLWRAASGVAHGKYWPTQDLQRIAYAENADGTPTDREILVPDTKVMVELVEAAYHMTQFGVLRYADFCGANLAAIHQSALLGVSEALPLREGVDPAWKELMMAGMADRLAEMAVAKPHDAT